MYEFLSLHVSDAMTREPVTIREGTSLAEAEGIFEQHNFNGLPVVDENGRLRGVLTKLDLLKAFVFTPQSIVPHYEEILREPAARFLTSEPLAVTPDLPLTRVLERLVETRYKSFPVVNEGRLVGMIAREDVLRVIRRVAKPPA
jgi:CBS domain-containing protein